jgi:hypothetical protein
MKILYPDNISTITADSEDSDYPVANVQDNHPQKVWKAASGVTTATLSIVTSASGAAGLHIAWTNATSGTVTVKNSTEVTTYETHSLSGAWGRFFAKFTTARTEVLHITVALTAPATVYAGVVRCGTLIAFKDPLRELTGGRKDYSIKKDLSNGGLSIALRNMPRAYQLSFIAEDAQYDTIDNLYLLRGSLPLAILISDNKYVAGSGDQWSGFFHILDPPDGKFSAGLGQTGWNIGIQEAV